MSAPIEHIRLSQQAKDQLLKLKRKTGIQHWNVLCRWAFCLSLAEPGTSSPAKIPADSSVEMTWKVFGGAYADIYLALLKQRCQQDGLGVSDYVLAAQFRLHLPRGLERLATNRQPANISLLDNKARRQLPSTSFIEAIDERTI